MVIMSPQLTSCHHNLHKWADLSQKGYHSTKPTKSVSTEVEPLPYIWRVPTNTDHDTDSHFSWEPTNTDHDTDSHFSWEPTNTDHDTDSLFMGATESKSVNDRNSDNNDKNKN